jgi:hypothetical protein
MRFKVTFSWEISTFDLNRKSFPHASVNDLSTYIKKRQEHGRQKIGDRNGSDDLGRLTEDGDRYVILSLN